MLSEGLIASIEKADLAALDDVELDDHGNIRFAEISLAQIVKDQVRKRLAARGIDITIVNKNLGYELRSLPANSYDLEYTQNLGYSAVRYLLAGGSRAIIAIRDGGQYIIPLDEIVNPQTGRIKTRLVDLDNPYYKMCFDYMIRLQRSDFDDLKRLSRLARVANCTPEEFRGQFGYLASDG
jgi:6-phosphofructokinase 1